MKHKQKLQSVRLLNKKISDNNLYSNTRLSIKDNNNKVINSVTSKITNKNDNINFKKYHQRHSVNFNPAILANKGGVYTNEDKPNSEDNSTKQNIRPFIVESIYYGREQRDSFNDRLGITSSIINKLIGENEKESQAIISSLNIDKSHDLKQLPRYSTASKDSTIQMLKLQEELCKKKNKIINNNPLQVPNFEDFDQSDSKSIISLKNYSASYSYRSNKSKCSISVDKSNARFIQESEADNNNINNLPHSSKQKHSNQPFSCEFAAVNSKVKKADIINQYHSDQKLNQLVHNNKASTRKSSLFKKEKEKDFTTKYIHSSTDAADIKMHKISSKILTSLLKENLMNYSKNKNEASVLKDLKNINVPISFIIDKSKQYDLDLIREEFRGNYMITSKDSAAGNNFLEEEDDSHNELNKDFSRCLLKKGHVYDSNSDEEDDDTINQIFYIHPESNFKYFLDLLVAICSFYSMILTPLVLAFYLGSSFEFRDYFFYVEIFVDLVFIADVIFSLFLGFLDMEERLITAHRKMVINYSLSWMVIDILSAFPFNTIVTIAQDQDVNYSSLLFETFHYVSSEWRLLRLLIVIRYLKLIKIFRANKFLQSFHSRYFDNQRLGSTLSRMLDFIFYLMIVTHLLACVFIYLANLGQPNWIYYSGIQDEEDSDIYIASVYFILSTIFTIGYGDIVSKNNYERVFNLMLLMVGILIYSYAVTSLSNMIQFQDEKTVRFNKRKEYLEQMKLKYSIPGQLNDKIMRFIKYEKTANKGDKNEFLQDLPKSMKNEMILKMYGPMIDNFIFFRNFDNVEFINKVIMALKPFNAVKNDRLVKEGDFLEEIIFVKHGALVLEVGINVVSQLKSTITTTNNNNNNNNKKVRKMSFNESLSRSNSFDATFKRRLTQLTNNYSRKASEKSLDKSKWGDENDMSKGDIREILDEVNTLQQIETQFLKIIELRRNEHFGDVLMFLNRRSPLSIRVKTKTTELYLMKKTDIVNISVSFPDIFEKITRKSAFNQKQLDTLIKRTKILFYENHKDEFLVQYQISDNEMDKDQDKEREQWENENGNLDNERKEIFIKDSLIKNSVESSQDHFSQNGHEKGVTQKQIRHDVTKPTPPKKPKRNLVFNKPLHYKDFLDKKNLSLYAIPSSESNKDDDDDEFNSEGKTKTKSKNENESDINEVSNEHKEIGLRKYKIKDVNDRLKPNLQTKMTITEEVEEEYLEKLEEIDDNQNKEKKTQNIYDNQTMLNIKVSPQFKSAYKTNSNISVVEDLTCLISNTKISRKSSGRSITSKKSSGKSLTSKKSSGTSLTSKKSSGRSITSRKNSRKSMTSKKDITDSNINLSISPKKGGLKKQTTKNSKHISFKRFSFDTINSEIHEDTIKSVVESSINHITPLKKQIEYFSKSIVIRKNNIPNISRLSSNSSSNSSLSDGKSIPFNLKNKSSRFNISNKPIVKKLSSNSLENNPNLKNNNENSDKNEKLEKKSSPVLYNFNINNNFNFDNYDKHDKPLSTINQVNCPNCKMICFQLSNNRNLMVDPKLDKSKINIEKYLTWTQIESKSCESFSIASSKSFLSVTSIKNISTIKETRDELEKGRSVLSNLHTLISDKFLPRIEDIKSKFSLDHNNASKSFSIDTSLKLKHYQDNFNFDRDKRIRSLSLIEKNKQVQLNPLSSNLTNKSSMNVQRRSFSLINKDKEKDKDKDKDNKIKKSKTKKPVSKNNAEDNVLMQIHKNIERSSLNLNDPQFFYSELFQKAIDKKENLKKKKINLFEVEQLSKRMDRLEKRFLDSNFR